MSRSRYRSDRGLIARMGLTMFLLGLLFVVLGGVLVYFFDAFGWSSSSPDSSLRSGSSATSSRSMAWAERS